MSIDAWINPRILARDAAALRRTFETDGFSSLVIDGLLQPVPLAGLRALFDRDGQFEALYGLIDRDGPSGAERFVDGTEFALADEDSRLAKELVLEGWAAECEASVGWQTHSEFVQLLEGDAFKAWLTELTGIDGLDEVAVMARIMRASDFCRDHDDTATRRRLCLLFYVDDDYERDFGGRFQNIVDGTVVRSVAPLGNRLLIHLPRVDLVHRVEAITTAAGRWRRCTYSIWFSAAS